MQFIVTHVPMYNVGIVCLTIPINSPAALHVNFNLLQAINYIKLYDIDTVLMQHYSCMRVEVQLLLSLSTTTLEFKCHHFGVWVSLLASLSNITDMVIASCLYWSNLKNTYVCSNECSYSSLTSCLQHGTGHMRLHIPWASFTNCLSVKRKILKACMRDLAM